MSDELALLARVSFTGTAMMGPIVLVAVIRKGNPSKGIIVISSLAFLTYLMSLMGIVPDHLGTVRLDLILYLFLLLSTLAIQFIKKTLH